MIGQVKERLKYLEKLRKKKTEIHSNKVRWAIIGTGNMANRFVRAIAITPGSTVVGIASRSKDRAKSFAKKHRIEKSYENYETMLKDQTLDIDVVYIAVPAFAHFEIIKSVLNHQKNVLCEKPIVQTSQELKELVALAKKNDLFLAEGMWMYCLPVYRKAEEWIKNNKIGRIKKIRVDLSKQEKIDYSRTIYDVNKGGGVLLDYGIYPIAFATHYMNEDIHLRYFNCIKHERGFDEDWLIVLSDGMITADISISSVHNGDKKATIIGDKGCIVWPSQFNRTNSIILFDQTGEKCEEFSVEYNAEGYEYEVKEVQQAILNKKNECQIMNIRQSLKTISIIEKLKKSTSEEV